MATICETHNNFDDRTGTGATGAATATSAWNRLRTLYLQHGEANYIGEAISVISHSIQAAQQALQVNITSTATYY
jgi:hypothetical protein